MNSKWLTAPCSSYEVEKLESWLQDQAESGWVLEKDGIFLGFFHFLRGSGASVRYRLVPKSQSSQHTPDPEQEELCTQLGWAFICDHGSFLIYRSEDSNAPEMDTDYEVQAAALKTVKRQAWASLFCQISIWSWFLLRIGLEPARYLVTFGIGHCVMLAVYFAVLMADAMRQASYIRTLQKKLLKNIPLDHEADWRSHRVASKALRQLPLLMMVVCISSLLMTGYFLSEKQTPITQSDDPPFATLADLCPGWDYQQAHMSTPYNTYTQWGNLAARDNYEWYESADMTSPDRKTISAGMIVDYNEVCSPAVARKLAKEYYRRDSREKGFRQLEAPSVDTDYIRAYNNVARTILIQKKNIVVKVTFIGSAFDDDVLCEEWLKITLSNLDRR